MDYKTISKIVQSVNNLERVISSVSASLSSADKCNITLMSRLDSYHEILDRQRKLLRDLFEAAQRGELARAEKIRDLIYGSSLMIEVDVGFMLSLLRRESKSSQHRVAQAA